jgi:hypothetical protein
MTPNIWVEKDFRNTLMEVFKKRKLDLVPATCEGKEGICILSLPLEEITKVLGAINRGVKINSTGLMTAKIMGTDIFVNVVSVHKL